MWSQKTLIDQHDKVLIPQLGPQDFGLGHVSTYFFMSYMSSSKWLVFAFTSCVMVSCAHAWMHGNAEPGKDDPERSQSASEMLRRLWGAAQERAEHARQQRVQAEAQGQTYTPTNAEMFAQFMDYTRDKVQNPPLLQAERNDVLLLQLIQSLAKEVARCNRQSPPPDPARPEIKEGIRVHQAIADAKLTPIQGQRYTIIIGDKK